MFPQKKMKLKQDDFKKQEPYHSNSNLLSQTIQWINFINSEKKYEDFQKDEDTKIDFEKEQEIPEKKEKLNTNDFAKFNNITKKN